jgi:uroporphyrinogen decarboxylase
MSNRFQAAVAGDPQAVPPVWLMRQAGRYQDTYQALRREHSFEDLCRTAALSARVALSSIEDFDFDAAILFSDLLFPLDALGLGLSYSDHGPRLSARFTDGVAASVPNLDALADALSFQAEAVRETRRQLPSEKGLIGFIGGPWTLFVYATEGTHAGSLARAKSSLDLYWRFADLVTPLLERMAAAQLEAGADLVMVFDTAAGELAPGAFRRHVVPGLDRLANALPGRLGYFARGLHPAHLEGPTAISSAPWAGIGVDWRWHLPDLLKTPARAGFVQGNFDPALLHLTGDELNRALDEFLAPMIAMDPAERRGWVCGLGHGVLPATPMESVRTFVREVRARLA